MGANLSEENLTGEITSITYRNDENGWTVLKLSIDGYPEPVTATGSLNQASAGEHVKIKGFWHNHNSYGRQFKITDFEATLPNSQSGMLRYLSSGRIDGHDRPGS